MSEQLTAINVKDLEDFFSFGEELLGFKVHMMNVDEFILLLGKNSAVPVRIFAPVLPQHLCVYTRRYGLSRLAGRHQSAYFADVLPTVAKSDKLARMVFENTSYVANVAEKENQLRVDINMTLPQAQVKTKVKQLLGQWPVNWSVQTVHESRRKTL
ncbi:hypothetical protein HY388_00615 [Candidatus Daviesbacteria bacterium]|nr:hypothetical protein [Candidatus Daviesbacteria bacterium]